MENQKIEELIKAAEIIINGNTNVAKSIQILETKISLRTYSIKEAMTETGLGYLKITKALNSGEIPFIRDGKARRMHHCDLLAYMNLQKQFKIN